MCIRDSSNTHSEEQLAQIAASIKRFGFNNPILIDENKMIIAGEGRYMAAKTLSRKKVPTIMLKHLSEAQRRAFLIADNLIARNSSWDIEKLTAELKDLRFARFDLGELGFSERDLKKLIQDTDDVINGNLSSQNDNDEDNKTETFVSGHTRSVKLDKESVATKGKSRQLAVLVLCKNIEEQTEVNKQLTENGFKCQNTVI
jgi:ParB-like chromosome segregation protein Spo0J